MYMYIFLSHKNKTVLSIYFSILIFPIQVYIQKKKTKNNLNIYL